MKKTAFILLAAFGIAKAQIKVLSNSNMGIGTTSPQAKLQVEGSKMFYDQPLLRLQSNRGGDGSAATIDFATYGSCGTAARIMAIDRNNFGADLRFYVNRGGVAWGNGLIEILRLGYEGNGSFYGSLWQQQSWINSDQKLKKDVVTAEKSLDKILSLRGVNYNAVDSVDRELMLGFESTGTLKWSNLTKSKVAYGAKLPQKNTYGFVAQDVEKVLPNLVHTSETGLKSVNYIAVIPILVEALKEQNKNIEALEAKVKKLEKGKTAARTEGNSQHNRKHLWHLPLPKHSKSFLSGNTDSLFSSGKYWQCFHYYYWFGRQTNKNFACCN